MSDRNNKYIEETEPLFRLLRMEAFRFIIVRYNHYSLVTKLKDDLKLLFPNRPRFYIDADHVDFRSLVDSYYAAEKGFFFIENFEKVLSNPEIYNALNQHRDKLASCPIALIVFISPATEELFAREIMEKMPDLWSLRSLLLDIKSDTSSFLKGQQFGQYTIQEQVTPTTLGGITSEEKQKELNRLRTRYEKTPENDYKLLRAAYRQIAKILVDLSMHGEALEYYLKLEKIELENLMDLEDTYNHIIAHHSKNKEWNIVNEYYIKLETIRKIMKDEDCLNLTSKGVSTIYFSYAWADTIEKGESREKIVNELYESLKEDGYNLKRDKMDLGYQQLISKFMKEIGKGNLVVVAFSEKYLKSPYCMFELLEIDRTSQQDKSIFSKRVYPLWAESLPLDNLKFKGELYDYWDIKYVEFDQYIRKYLKKISKEEFREFELIKKINENISRLITVLKDINALNKERLTKDNFAIVKEAIEERIRLVL